MGVPGAMGRGYYFPMKIFAFFKQENFQKMSAVDFLHNFQELWSNFQEIL